MDIVIIFGGTSVEHDVSILTALHARKHVMASHSIRMVYLTRTGQMVTSQSLCNIDNFINGDASRANPCFFVGKSLFQKTRLGVKKVCNVDVVLNCCHGGVGEDGRLCGMFDVLGIPVTSCDYRVAADLQSKTRTREILSAAGFDQPKFKSSSKSCFAGVNYSTLEECDLRGGIAFPVIVKPDTLGSSIGITVARNQEEFEKAVELAFTLDDRIIVEEFLKDAVEINCAAFRFGDKVLLSGCWEMDKGDGLLDFDKKYICEEGGFMKKGAKGGGKMNEKHEREEDVKNLMKQAYELFGASGVVRGDFLIVGGKIYLNEINTIPGNFSFHMWQKVGLPYATLIEMMLDQAVKQGRKDPKMAFHSEILQKNRFLVQ